MTPVTAGAGTALRTREWPTPRAMPWWRIPLYPAAFGCAVVLMTWAQGLGLHPILLVRPMAVAIGAALGLTLLVAAVLRDRDRGATVASIGILAVLTSDDRLIVPLGVIALLIVVEGLLHRGRPALSTAMATQVMSVIGSILLLAVVMNTIQIGAVDGAIAALGTKPLPPPGAAVAGHPDIYLFLLDAYPGDRAAAHSTTFDPDAFPADLTARGIRGRPGCAFELPDDAADDRVDAFDAAPRRHPGPGPTGRIGG